MLWELSLAQQRCPRFLAVGAGVPPADSGLGKRTQVLFWLARGSLSELTSLDTAEMIRLVLCIHE